LRAPDSPLPKERCRVPLMPMLTQRFTADAPWMIDNYEALDGYTGFVQP